MPNPEYNPNEIEAKKAEMQSVIDKIEGSNIFNDNYLQQTKYILFAEQADKNQFEFQNGTYSAVETSDYKSRDFERGLRTDFVGLTDKESYERFDLQNLSDQQYLQTLFLQEKIPFDEFVVHETGHNVFDLSYKTKYGEFETFEMRDEQGQVRETDTDCSPEYIEKISHKIKELLSKHKIQVDLDKFQINRQKIAEIFALLIQREYAKRTNSSYPEHKDLEAKVTEFFSNPEAEIATINQKTNRNITLEDFYTENHMLSFIIVPYLEKKYPDFASRLQFFELDTQKYINE